MNQDKFECRSGFYTWTFRTSVNPTLNYCQRNSKLAFRSLDAEQQQQDDDQVRQVLKDFLSDDSSPDPATEVQSKELYRIAARVLMGLDEAHRAVIVLRDIEGMSYARIAEVLDIELGTVRSRLSRARSKMRDILEAILR